MRFLDDEHKQRMLECLRHGHRFSEWENIKYGSGISRCCENCKLHQSDEGGEKSEAYAIGSVWPSASSPSVTAALEELQPSCVRFP